MKAEDTIQISLLPDDSTSDGDFTLPQEHMTEILTDDSSQHNMILFSPKGSSLQHQKVKVELYPSQPSHVKLILNPPPVQIPPKHRAMKIDRLRTSASTNSCNMVDLPKPRAIFR